MMKENRLYCFCSRYSGDRALQYETVKFIDLPSIQNVFAFAISVEQFPQAHVLCPHFTRGPLRRMAVRHLQFPPVFLSAKEIEYSVDINRVALITSKGIKLVS